MKKFLLIACIAIIAFGCKRDENPIPQGLIGKWELRSSFGGFVGKVAAYPPGNGNLLLFNTDDTYKKYKNDTLIARGSYLVIKNSINMGQQKFDGLYYDNSQFGDIMQLKADTLIIGTSIDDQVGSVFVRQ